MKIAPALLAGCAVVAKAGADHADVQPSLRGNVPGASAGRGLRHDRRPRRSWRPADQSYGCRQGLVHRIGRDRQDGGGDDAAIILDDLDPKQVASKVFAGAMINSGQICLAIQRAYVDDSIYDEMCDEMARLADDAKSSGKSATCWSGRPLFTVQFKRTASR